MVLMGESPVIDTGDVQLAAEISPWNIVVMIIYLTLIVLACYFLTKYVGKRALAKGMRKRPAGAGARRAGRSGPGSLVCVADRIAVERDKTVMVVEFHGKYYLLSTTQQDIELIDSVPIPPEVLAEREREEAELLKQAEEAAARGAEGVTFGGFMGELGTEMKNRAYAFFHKGKLPPARPSFEDHLKQKLKEEETGGKTAKTEEKK